MAETKVVNLEVKTNVEPLKKQLKEAQKEVEALAAKFGDTSAEAVNAAKKAALLKDAIGDAKALTDSFNPDAKFNALSGSLSGVAGGFSAVQGAMGLIGVDSKNVEATLLKVQSAMAFSEGLNSVLAAKDAFKNLAAVIGQTAIGQKLLNVAQVVGATVMKALNFVMKQNPIFLIIAGITAAVAAFKYFTQSTDKAALAQEELNRKQEISIRLMKVQQEDTDKYISRLEKNSRDKIALAKAEGANSEEIFQLEKARLEDQIRYRKVLYDYDVKLTAEQYAQQKQDKFDLKLLEAQHRTDLAKIEEEKTAKEKEEAQKRIDNKKDELDKKAAQDEADWEKKKADRIANQQQYEIDLADAIKFDEDKHKAEVEALQKTADARKEANEKIVSDNKARVEKEIADENTLRQTKLQMVSSSLSILQDATSLFTAKNEKDARTQFKINKALSLSSAVVNTALAVTAALTAGGNPIKLATGMQFVEAGIAAASGGVSIAKISATQFTASGGSGGGGGSTPSGGGGGNNAQIQAPSFNIVGNNGLNQLSQLKQAPIQAYVVSGQMSTAQSLDRNRVRNATL
jgi:hypothetical protein